MDWENIDYVLYVRRRVVSLERYRHEYMGYLGGRRKVACGEHGVPLITVPSRRVGKKLCSLCGTVVS